MPCDQHKDFCDQESSDSGTDEYNRQQENKMSTPMNKREVNDQPKSSPGVLSLISSPFRALSNFVLNSPNTPSSAAAHKEHASTPKNNVSGRGAKGPSGSPALAAALASAEADKENSGDAAAAGVPSPSRYAAIAELDHDPEKEDERWTERTAIITRIDHEQYEKFARDIVNEVVSSVPEQSIARNEASAPLDDTVFQQDVSTAAGNNLAQNDASVAVVNREEEEPMDVSYLSLGVPTPKAKAPVPEQFSNIRERPAIPSVDDSDDGEFASAEQSFSSVTSSSTAPLVTASTSLEDINASGENDVLSEMNVTAKVNNDISMVMESLAGMSLFTPARAQEQGTVEGEAEDVLERESTPVNEPMDPVLENTMTGEQEEEDEVTFKMPPSKPLLQQLTSNVQHEEGEINQVELLEAKQDVKESNSKEDASLDVSSQVLEEVQRSEEAPVEILVPQQSQSVQRDKSETKPEEPAEVIQDAKEISSHEIDPEVPSQLQEELNAELLEEKKDTKESTSKEEASLEVSAQLQEDVKCVEDTPMEDLVPEPRQTAQLDEIEIKPEEPEVGKQDTKDSSLHEIDPEVSPQLQEEEQHAEELELPEVKKDIKQSNSEEDVSFEVSSQLQEEVQRAEDTAMEILVPEPSQTVQHDETETNPEYTSEEKRDTQDCSLQENDPEVSQQLQEEGDAKELELPEVKEDIKQSNSKEDVSFEVSAQLQEKVQHPEDTPMEILVPESSQTVEHDETEINTEYTSEEKRDTQDCSLQENDPEVSPQPQEEQHTEEITFNNSAPTTTTKEGVDQSMDLLEEELPDLVRVNPPQVETASEEGPNKETKKEKDTTPEFEAQEKKLLEEEKDEEEMKELNTIAQKQLYNLMNSDSAKNTPVKKRPVPLPSSEDKAASSQYNTSNLLLDMSATTPTTPPTALPPSLNLSTILGNASPMSTSGIFTAEQGTPTPLSNLRSPRASHLFLSQELQQSQLISSPSVSVPVEQLQDILVQNELLCTEQLLQKDKIIHEKQQQLSKITQDIEVIHLECQRAQQEEASMHLLLEECNKTITQIESERERDRLFYEIEKDKIVSSRNSVLEDLESSHRAYRDVQRKYERTKDIITNFKQNEDFLKEKVMELRGQVERGDERFEMLKAHVEGKLSEANQSLESVRRSREAEIAKLTAQLRKAELNVNSLERSLQEKSLENQELTKICDELIEKVGK